MLVLSQRMHSVHAYQVAYILVGKRLRTSMPVSFSLDYSLLSASLTLPAIEPWTRGDDIAQQVPD